MGLSNSTGKPEPQSPEEASTCAQRESLAALEASSLALAVSSNARFASSAFDDAILVFKRIIAFGNVLSRDGGPNYSVFYLEVSCDVTQPNTWYVYRRYSEFKKLYENLKDLNAPVLPSPRLIGSLDLDFVKQRKDHLEAWLLNLIDRLNLNERCKNLHYRRFLTYNANIPPLSLRTIYPDHIEIKDCKQASDIVRIESGSTASVYVGGGSKSPDFLLQNSVYCQLFGPLKDGRSDSEKIKGLYDSLGFKMGYEGGFDSNGKKSGKGISCSKSGVIYDGEYLGNLQHGLGVELYPSGNVYEGAWLHNKYSGHAVYQYSSGSSYEGEYIDNSRSGYGIHRIADKRVYVGQFLNDFYSGCGIMYYPNGAVYEGQYLNGKQSGWGIFRKADGTVTKGRWLDDSYVNE
jgi:hypothetical protein